MKMARARPRRTVPPIGRVPTSCPSRPGVRNSPPVDAPRRRRPWTSSTTKFETWRCRFTWPRSARTSATSSPPRTPAIDRLSRRYRELLQSLSPGEQMKHRARARAAGGRSQAPGVAAAEDPRREHREHARPRGGRRRARGSPHHGRLVVATSARAPTAELGVGGDVESWCGRCGESTTHNIVAMVGERAEAGALSGLRLAPHAPHRARAPARAASPARRGGEARIARAPSIPRPSGRPPSCARSARRSPPPPPCASSIRRSATRPARSSSTPSTGAARSRTSCARACSSAFRSAA